MQGETLRDILRNRDVDRNTAVMRLASLVNEFVKTLDNPYRSEKESLYYVLGGIDCITTICMTMTILSFDNEELEKIREACTFLRSDIYEEISKPCYDRFLY